MCVNALWKVQRKGRKEPTVITGLLQHGKAHMYYYRILQSNITRANAIWHSISESLSLG